MRLENKVALISGGARGMGEVEAKLFAQEGAKVVIGDVLDEDGRRTEAAINEMGGVCVFVHLDVTDEAQWRTAVNEAVSRYGKLDILVNNAGIYRTNTVLETSTTEWEQVMDINAKGVFLGTKSAIPEMKKNGAGSIVNISSVAGCFQEVQVAAESLIPPAEFGADHALLQEYFVEAGTILREVARLNAAGDPEQAQLEVVRLQQSFCNARLRTSSPLSPYSSEAGRTTVVESPFS